LTNLLRFAGGPTFFGEKRFRVGLGTQGVSLPREGTLFFSNTGDSEVDWVNKPVVWY
jgi:hypothetical protein